MRAVTAGVKVVVGLLGISVCLLLVLVFFCIIDRSSTIDATTRLTIDTLPSRHPSSLTPVQLNSAVTIEFDFNHIDLKNRTALNTAYREVRRTVLEYLNRRKSTTASPTYSTTTASTTTAVVTTAITPTTAPTTMIATTSTTPTTDATYILGTPSRQRKRKRRNSGGNNCIFTEEDLPFVDNDPEIDENGNLRISLFPDKDGVGDLDLDEHLYEVAKALNKSGKLEAAAKAPIVNIFKGLPRRLSPVVTLQLEFKLWLPILLTTVVLLLICIFILVRYWCARNKKNIGKREISSSIDGLITERTDTLRESEGRRRMDFPQHEICAISSNEKETKEQIVWGKLNLMGH